MEIKHRAIIAVEVLTLSGRFDAYEVPAVEKWLEEHLQVHNVVVNLREVTFIDSSGLAALVKGLKRCRQNGGELVLSDLQQAVRIIFELTRLDKAFRIFPTEADAVKGLSGQGQPHAANN